MFFSKKEEVLIKPNRKKEKRIKMPKDQPLEGDFPQDDYTPEDFSRQDEDEYASFLPDEMEDAEPEQRPRRGRAKKEKPAPKRKKPPKSEVPFYRNRLVIGASSVIFACLIAFVLVPIMSYVTSTEMSTAVKVIVPIEKGQQIAATMVQTVQSPAMGLTGDALRDVSEAVGKYATVDMVAGDTVLTSKLAAAAPYPDAYLYTLAQGEQAISLTIQSFAGGLSGKLLAGDVVSVYATPNQTDAAATEAERGYSAIQPPELTYMRVLAVTDKLGGDKQLDNVSSSTDETVQDEETQPVTVTLLADTVQAAAIAGLETSSKLHLSLITRGDEKAATHALDAQKDFLAKQLAQKESEEMSEEEIENMLSDLLAEEDATGDTDTPTIPAQEKAPAASSQPNVPAKAPASNQPTAPAKAPAASSQPSAPAQEKAPAEIAKPAAPAQGEVKKGE